MNVGPTHIHADARGSNRRAPMKELQLGCGDDGVYTSKPLDAVKGAIRRDDDVDAAVERSGRVQRVTTVQPGRVAGELQAQPQVAVGEVMQLTEQHHGFRRLNCADPVAGPAGPLVEQLLDGLDAGLRFQICSAIRI